MSYCDKQNTKKSGWAACRYLGDYYYRSINEYKKNLNNEIKIKHASYFREEAGFYYEDNNGKLCTMFQNIIKIGCPLRPMK